MKIDSLSKIIALPFLIAFGLILYYSMDYEYRKLSVYLIPLGITIAIIYVFNPQIDFFWKKRNPPRLDPPVLAWLDKYCGFYQNLDEHNKNTFRDRLAIFIAAKEYIAMGNKPESVPDDIQAIISQEAIKFSFDKEDYLFEHYDRIVIYKHPFPSPAKQFLHSMEVHHEDGVFLFSLEHLVPGILNKEFYNICLHAFTEGFIEQNLNLNYPNLDDSIWQDLEKISGMTMERVNNIIGYELKDPLPVAINYYFEYPEAFIAQRPELYGKIKNLLS